MSKRIIDLVVWRDGEYGCWKSWEFGNVWGARLEVTRDGWHLSFALGEYPTENDVGVNVDIPLTRAQVRRLLDSAQIEGFEIDDEVRTTVVPARQFMDPLEKLFEEFKQKAMVLMSGPGPCERESGGEDHDD
jgi:hypothetical protein